MATATATATVDKCWECGETEGGTLGWRFYGNGAARCMPKCVKKFERRLNKRRGQGGQFERKS